MHSCCKYFMITDLAVFWTSKLKEAEKGTPHIQERKSLLQVTGLNIFLIYF